MSIAITIFVMVFAGNKLIRLGKKQSPDTSVTESFINLQTDFTPYNLRVLSYEIMVMIKDPIFFGDIPSSVGQVVAKTFDPDKQNNPDKGDKFLPVTKYTQEGL
jgi:hypothetical protein